MTSDLEGYNAVLYARVSTDDQGQTCETQKLLKDLMKAFTEEDEGQ